MAPLINSLNLILIEQELGTYHIFNKMHHFVHLMNWKQIHGHKNVISQGQSIACNEVPFNGRCNDNQKLMFLFYQRFNKLEPFFSLIEMQNYRK